MKRFPIGVLLFIGASCATWQRSDVGASALLTEAKISPTDATLASARIELATLHKERTLRLSMLAEARHEDGRDHDFEADRIDALEQRVDELAVLEMKAARRIELLHAFITRMAGAVDVGTLAVIVRDGELVLQVPSDVLFSADESVLALSGKKTLFEIADALRSVGGKDFVALDSDRPFPTPREIAITELLVGQGVPRNEVSPRADGSRLVEVVIHSAIVVLENEEEDW